ncbi:phage tail protein [Archangium primigenium]|uniref:phage tail protein n=1 Tax=[Archangium] primigenium TaxID=2792470 RepID=UPI001959B1F1|nr:phage tail protein [Archangium primigenium]MBM7116688.1 phage tail protein [Archangium primigenium]
MDKTLSSGDLLATYNFKVELGGITRAGFKECSGLESTIGAVKYREGTDPTLAQRQLPGLQSVSNIVLKRGISQDNALWEWHKQAIEGKVTRRDISIVLRDDQGNDKIWWNVKNCWPTKWSGPTLDATSESTAIETLELAHEGISVQSWK